MLVYCEEDIFESQSLLKHLIHYNTDEKLLFKQHCKNGIVNVSSKHSDAYYF